VNDAVLLGAPVLLPLAAAVLAFAGGARLRRALTVALCAVLTAAAVLLAGAVWHRGIITHHVGGWMPPLGILLRADGLAALMVLMNTAVGIAVSVFAAGCFSGHDGSDSGGSHGRLDVFWPLWFMLWGALNALFLSGDVFNLYVTLELVGLSGVALISLAGKKAWPAAMRYLLVSLLASLSYLLGTALLYGQFGVLDLAGLGRGMADVPAARAAAALMFVGLMAKTALVPLHAWLPPAHAGAPAPVSAVLSALVIKGSFYLFLRLWFEVFPALTPAVLAQAVGLFGSAAILWGSALALRQSRLKMVVAYSTVAQVGYLFLLFPLATGAAASVAPLAIVFHAVSHACAKAAMFMAAGALMLAYGTDDIRALRGAAVQASAPALAFAMGALVLIGLPPGGNFAAKWLLLDASFTSGQWWWIPVIAAGTLLASAYLYRVLTIFMRSSGSEPPASAVRAPLAAPALALAVAALLLALAAPALSGLLARAPAPGVPSSALTGGPP
jgi:formate hydrogenlyase subunit 3/multisubunit Na+/H+ antiporter MnhD subunit